MFIILLLISKKKNIENFYIIQPRPQLLKEFKNKKFVIIGIGGYKDKIIDDIISLKKTNKYKFISFQSTFKFFIDKLKFEPDYYFYGDPNGVKDTFTYIKNNKLKTKVIALNHYVQPKTQKSISVRSNTYRNNNKWNKYITDFKNLNEHNKLIIDDFILDEFKKYNYNDIIKTRGETEKLSTHILPLCNYLDLKEVYIVGFDCIFEDWKARESRLKISIENDLGNIMKKYNKYIYNLTPDDKTLLKGYIKHKNIKELL